MMSKKSAKDGKEDDKPSEVNTQYKTSISAITNTTDSNGDDDNDDDEEFVEAMEELHAVDDTEDDSHIGQHSELKKLCVMNCGTKKRIIPNAEPVAIDNDLFSGHVFLMVRTPDVDAKKPDPNVQLSENPSRISKYFKDKKRRFEFQFQFKMKRIPDGPLFLGCELEHPIKVGTITKGLVNLLLAMVRRINPGFHYSWGPDEKTARKEDLESGNYEKTHLSFPLEASMDRVVVTKPGETPPKLGHELFETNESVKRRRKTGFGSVPFNTTDTFTVCLWSQYCDWIKWKSMNVPGVSPFLMSRVTGSQPIYLCVYEVGNCTPAEYKKHRPGHLRKHLQISHRMEFSNSEFTTGGMAEQVIPERRAKSKQSQRQGLQSEHSFGDTESVNSDMETKSRITVM